MNDIHHLHILLVEDDAGDAALARAALRAVRGVRIEERWARSLEEARQAYRDKTPDVLLLDLSLPDSTGLDTIRRALALDRGVPIIVLTGHDSEEYALHALQAGAQDYLVKGAFDGDSLRRVIRHALGRAAVEKQNRLLAGALEATANAVVITDAEARIDWVNRAFEQLSGYARGEILGKKPQELISSGRQSPEFYQELWHTILNGREWRGELVNRRRDGSCYPEEMSITPIRDGHGDITNFIAVKQDISARKQLEQELLRLATTDTLTELPNRRYFMERLTQELARLRRFGGQPAALLMLDLDRFKQVNDMHGHATGDEVLRGFAACIRDMLRQTDMAARLGGEEFAVMLTSTTAEGAGVFAERLRQKVAALRFSSERGEFSVTLSQGVTLLHTEDASPDRPLARADKALYRAKDLGRNRVETDFLSTQAIH